MNIFNTGIYTIFSLHPVVSIIKASVNNEYKIITIYQAKREEIDYDRHLVVNFQEFMQIVIKAKILSYTLQVSVEYIDGQYAGLGNLQIEDIYCLDKTINRNDLNDIYAYVNYNKSFGDNYTLVLSIRSANA